MKPLKEDIKDYALMFMATVIVILFLFIALTDSACAKKHHHYNWWPQVAPQTFKIEQYLCKNKAGYWFGSCKEDWKHEYFRSLDRNSTRH